MRAHRAFARKIITRKFLWRHVMEYRLLGRSGLKVSTIPLGTMTFGRASFACARRQSPSTKA